MACLTMGRACLSCSSRARGRRTAFPRRFPPWAGLAKPSELWPRVAAPSENTALGEPRSWLRGDGTFSELGGEMVSRLGAFGGRHRFDRQRGVDTAGITSAQGT